MRNLLVAALGALLFAPSAALAADTDVVHHEATVRLAPDQSRLEVVDRITLPEAIFALGQVELTLPAGLSPEAEGASLEVRAAAEKLQAQDAPKAAVAADLLVVSPEARTFTLRYGGPLDHAPTQHAGEHQRSFKTTPGIVSAEGAYLPAWLPAHRTVEAGRDRGGRYTFALRVEDLPEGWEVVLPGRRTAVDGAVLFESENPFAEVPLVAGPLTRTSRQVGDVEVSTLLRAEDPALSARYLDVTGQYLQMYEGLIGPYPYRSFTVVENFWETGYGMPGFTLLGPKVMRFPFILHSSYPHELLHNWWGNGVFLPASGGGNWAEGLTAYLADHLVKEQRGRGAEHRRSLLVRYRDFVSDEDDFALRGFAGRYSPQTEAVGYGKWAMVVHMLRRLLGDAAFRQLLTDFYEKHRFRRAGFEELQESAELVAGQRLDRFFEAWLDRTGAPVVEWADVQAYKAPGAPWEARVTLAQTQKAAPFPLRVPVAITLEDGQVEMVEVAFTGEETATARVEVPARPVRVDVDPAFDVFRLPHREEVAPSLSNALGAENALFVLPSWASDEEQSAWRAMAEKLCPRAGRCDIVVDKEAGVLPDDASVWILGYANLMRAGAFVGAKKYGARLDDRRLEVGDDRLDNAHHSLTLAFRNPKQPDEALVFVGADNLEAIAGLTRKLPHYGKYGYLAFRGAEPTNVAKGQWPNVGSPMTALLHPRADAELRLPEREPLAELPPPFDARRMSALVEELAGPAMKGRGYGSPGLERARARVEQAFREAGLDPWQTKSESGPGASYRQCYDDPKGPSGAFTACNLIGVVPGRRPELGAVVLAAHLDHLGEGWPPDAVREGNAGKVHPGANDNASGVAVLTEVARALAAAGGGDRPVWIVATTGEEAGLRGSKALLASLGPEVAERVHSAVVLDTVGRRVGDELLVLGHESAREWRHIFHGVGFVTGVKTGLGAEGLTASDHGAFLEVGVPAVQLFSGPSPEHHTPADTPEMVRPEDLVAAAQVARETVAYLADRKEPLSGTGSDAQPAAKSKPAVGRKVQTGAVPDFKFGGPGVRLHSVIEGSSLGQAGLKAGDVIVEVDGRALRDLRQYARILRLKEPGERMALKARRGDETLDVEIELQAR